MHTPDPRTSAPEPRAPSTVPAEPWDLVIRPKTGWFDLHLADLWRYRDLVSLFVWRDFVAQYKQTILGPVWFLLQPLMTTLVFTVVFGRLGKLPTDGLPMILFYMSGTVAWSYFATCLNNTSNTFIANAGLFGKVYFPRLAVPVSIVISQLIQFGLQFLFFLCFVAGYIFFDVPVRLTWAVALTPLLLLLMAGLGLGCGIIVSSLTTKYRDLRFLVHFGVQLAMYTAPVIYPLSMMDNASRFSWIVYLNPMTGIIEAFRYAFLGTGTCSALYLGWSAFCAAAVVLIGILLFNHVEKTFMDTV